MAEKNFKVASGIDAGGTITIPASSSIWFGDSLADLSFAAALGKVRFNGASLATEGYVDNAVANVSVNVEAIAGDGLSFDGANNEIDINYQTVAPALAGTGLLAPLGGTIEVNTEYVANAIAGEGLAFSSVDNKLKVDYGNGLWLHPATNKLDLNLDSGGGLRFNQGTLAINIDGGGVVPAQGLTFANGMLAANVTDGLMIDQNSGKIGVNAGNGIDVSGGTVDVNTDFVGEALKGGYTDVDGGGLPVTRSQLGKFQIQKTDISNGLAGNGLIDTLGTLSVNTEYVANAIAGTNLAFDPTTNKLKLTDSPTVSGNLTVTGNLTVQGNTTTLNTETLLVEDNLIVLNSSVTGTPSTNAGIEVERGTSTNASLYFDEASDTWKANNGTSTVTIVDAPTVGQSITSTNGVVTWNYATNKLDLNVGSTLGVDQASGTLQVNTTYITETIAAAAGDGLIFDPIMNLLMVNTDYVGSAIAGNGTKFENGKINVGEGNGITVNNDHIAVNTSYIVSNIAGEGLAVDSSNNTLKVNIGNDMTGPVPQGLTFNQGMLAVNAGSNFEFDLYTGKLNLSISSIADGITIVEDNGHLAVNQFGTSTKLDGDSAVVSYGTYVKNFVGHSTANSNTYATVATVPYDADAFEALVTIMAPGYSESRTSKIVGTTNGSSTVEYTEFAIVDNFNNVSSPDVLVEYDQVAGGYLIKGKATVGQGDVIVIADVKYMKAAHN